MTIPYNNLRPSHDPFLKEYLKDVQDLLHDCDFVGASSKKAAAFECDFAGYIGTKHALGVASGTDALLLALHALNIGAGDEVLMPAFGFIATADVAIRLGAKPVFVDVDPVSFNIDPAKIEAAITPRTKAIIPVHLFGLACDMDAILEIATRHKLAVVEDVAQACGTLHREKRCGSLGAFGAFSFYPTKNLGGAGDGGMITTNDDALAEKIRMFRDHGRTRAGEFECIGYNSRLDTIQALYLHRKLVDLDEAIEDRVANAQLYNELFAGTEIVTPAIPSDASHSFNYYTVRVRDRNHLKNYLQEKGVGAAIYYKEAMHETPALKSLGFQPGAFPVAEQACREVLTLPNWPGMKKKEIEFVAQVVSEFLANNNKNVVAPVS